MTKTMLLLMLVVAAGLNTGCSKKADEIYQEASPICADLDKITDPTKKAELLKKCPRGGPGFKPSDKKEW
jgi:entry exclusion lipoprotein TrbK